MSRSLDELYRETDGLLFLRTGFVASADSQFPSALASKYNAALVSPGAITAELKSQGVDDSDMLKIATADLVGTAIRESLTAGRNVVYGGALNTLNRRNLLRTMAAAIGGVSMVLMQVETKLEVIESRLSGLDDATRKKMRQDIERQRPVLRRERPSRRGESYVWLDGGIDKGELLDKIQLYIRKRRLGVWREVPGRPDTFGDLD